MGPVQGCGHGGVQAVNDLIVMLGYCGVYATWVLVPLVPAILIYRLFPKAPTETQWKILGVVLKAGGASGFYFAILALAYFKFIDPAIQNVKNFERPYWEVIARIRFVDENRKIINPNSSEEQLRVHPLSHRLKKIDDKSYVATLRFSEPNDETPDYVEVDFPEGEGFIKLKQLKNNENTSLIRKVIDLTNLDPIEIHPIKQGGQNQPTNDGLSQQVNRSLESNEHR
jgi:hypothetical protein